MSRIAVGGHARMVLGFGWLLLAALARADGPAAFDAARAFGARPSVMDLSLSPDGMQVAYIAPSKDQGTGLVTGRLEAGFKGKLVMLLDGKPLRLQRCSWVSNERLVCQVHGVVPDPGGAGLLPVSRWLAVNADGSNIQTLATRRNEYSRGYFLRDGEIIDYLPDEDGAVLMSREYTPDMHTNSHIGSDKEGLGVDWVDTRNLTVKNVIPPRPGVFEYLSDGRGAVRVMGVTEHVAGNLESGVSLFYYRAVGSTDWHPLSKYDYRDRSGFEPIAVDHDLNVAYGLRRTDGRNALYTIRLDDSLQEQLVYSRPDVDVSGVLRLGRRRRVVGAGYITDRSQAELFDAPLKQLLGALSRALPQQQLRVTDSSVDEGRLLVFSGSDTDPGVYYLFDRKSHHLDTFLVVRSALEGVKLAKVKPITYPADDGVMVPAYLTLPPGKEDARGLPAIVLPHGGPESRDQWGFDWLPQFFANRGYAVLQPEFRGSAGYGDNWFQQNGFRSWRVAIGDVLSAGRWLVSQGIADPARLGIVGWSYGGYAALQSNVVDPQLFKAVVAIAPVTDLKALAEEWRHWSNFELEKERLGEGSDAREASPIEHVSSFKAPVLLFHGTHDRNVGYQESVAMAEKLKSAGVKSELVSFKDLDHALDDSAAREELLRRSDEFLQAAFKGGGAAH